MTAEAAKYDGYVVVHMPASDRWLACKETGYGPNAMRVDPFTGRVLWYSSNGYSNADSYGSEGDAWRAIDYHLMVEADGAGVVYRYGEAYRGGHQPPRSLGRWWRAFLPKPLR